MPDVQVVHRLGQRCQLGAERPGPPSAPGLDRDSCLLQHAADALAADARDGGDPVGGQSLAQVKMPDLLSQVSTRRICGAGSSRGGAAIGLRVAIRTTTQAHGAASCPWQGPLAFVRDFGEPLRR